MTAKKSWRDVLPVHPAANAFPMMGDDELMALAKDIKKNGLGVPLVLWQAEKGAPLLLLDGRNRLDAAEAVGLPVLDQEGKGLDCSVRCDRVCGGDPYKLVLCFNLHRRHLNADEKRQAIVALLKATPDKSNRQIAKQAKVSHPHVAKVRAEMERSGDVETVTTSTDTKGRKQPVHKPVKKRRPADDFLDTSEDEGEQTPEERWQNSLANLCGDVIARQPYWDKHFPGWKEFDCPSHIKTLVKEAATAMTSLAATVAEREAAA